MADTATRNSNANGCEITSNQKKHKHHRSDKEGSKVREHTLLLITCFSLIMYATERRKCNMGPLNLANKKITVQCSNSWPPCKNFELQKNNSCIRRRSAALPCIHVQFHIAKYNLKMWKVSSGRSGLV